MYHTLVTDRPNIVTNINSKSKCIIFSIDKEYKHRKTNSRLSQSHLKFKFIPSSMCIRKVRVGLI